MSSDLEPVPDVEPIAHGSKFGPADIDAGLLACATLGGTVAASRHLAASGLKVSSRTLRTWRRNYPRRLQALAERHAPEIERATIARAKAAALHATAGAEEAIDLERQRIANGDVKDASASAQRLSIAAGISTDKALVLEGRPSQITEHRQDVHEALDELNERFPGLFLSGFGTAVDSTATEVEPDEPEEPPELPPAA